jgi:(p)ppGpp synthase/HD superfamily hydrolase
VLRAISFAARAHQGQLRKDRSTPYVAHPLRVMTVLLTVFQVDDPELLATAVLHDCIEDTTTDCDDLERQFGLRVAKYVALLSKDKRKLEEDRERTYFATLSAAPAEVKLCKLADVYDNLLDCQGMPPAARAKTADQARTLLNLFSDDLRDRWPHVLRGVAELIERAAGQ